MKSETQYLKTGRCPAEVERQTSSANWPREHSARWAVQRGSCLLLCLVFLCANSNLRAQPALSDLVFTVGTTIQDSSLQNWSYVLLNSADDRILAGKRFAVFAKEGDPASANPFTQRGVMARQSDAAAIEALLVQAAVLGQNRPSLSNALNFMFSDSPGITNQTLGQKILTALNAATTNPEAMDTLSVLSRGHPGLTLALGQGFSERINTILTYEIREIDPLTSVPGEVIGRVTLVPGAPVVLPSPGRPFQVVTNDPSDHLRIRLRWGTPPDLRRLSPLQYGYNVWRISRSAAEAANFHITPPTTSELYGNANFTRVNGAIVTPLVELDTGGGLTGAENPADRITHFIADTGRSTGTFFTDGQEFYYFVTARDILGRDGLPSPGGLARACRRLRPSAPFDVKVENTVLPGSTNSPRLLVSWEQNTNTTEAVSHYWVYRWANPSAVLTNDAAPLAGRVGLVAATPGTNRNHFLDNTAGALTAPNSTNVWYTVRSVSEAACDPLLSPHSSPAWGVLRQREGPAATAGQLIGSCGTPVVMFQNFVTNLINGDTQSLHIRLTCVRRDPGIVWTMFNITNTMGFDVKTIGPIYFPPDGDRVQIDYDPPAYITSQARQIEIGCVVGTADDRGSSEATCVFSTPFPYTQQREAVFVSGLLLATALNGNDPLLTKLNGLNSACIPPYSVVPDASGMVAMQFDFAGSPTVLIQALDGNVWTDVAVVTPDENRVYWVSYPACLIGPLPDFRACRINFPADNGDCEQHVTAGADGGAIAPIRVRFQLTPRTQEYRVYRKIDDGPMTLLAQGAAAFDPAKPGKILETKDEALPPSAARLCYFVQLLDEHGNGSPMAFIGCKSVKPAKLHRPVLAEPQQTGDLSNPQVLLNWFSPTAGVSRFQFKVSLVESPTPQASSGLFSVLLTPVAAHNKSLAFQGLTKGSLKIVSFSEAHFTPYIGPSFGPGPQFTVSARVIPDATYEICVTPVDEQGKVHHGSTSEIWRFKWTPPVVLATVPWPARPLPPVRNFEPSDAADYSPRVAAMVFTNDNGALIDRRFPVGIRIGRFDNSLFFRGSFGGNVGTNTYIRLSGANTIVNPDPHHGLFRSLASDASLANRPILPIVIYRQQVTNLIFPRVSGDVTQVSPLIERIPWTFSPNTREVIIPDRLFAMFGETYNDRSYYFLYVRDQQPVLRGAKYRYFVTRFNAKREPEEIIPAGEVDIPIL